jgi:hypothetical protein
MYKRIEKVMTTKYRGNKVYSAYKNLTSVVHKQLPAIQVWIDVDMVFWLIGSNAPIMKIYFKCILKKIRKIEQKNPGMHMNILCQSIKIWVIKDIFCGLCKNDKKNSYVNSNFVALKIVFFIQVKKIIFLLQNLVSEHKMSRYTLRIFFQNF